MGEEQCLRSQSTALTGPTVVGYGEEGGTIACQLNKVKELDFYFSLIDMSLFWFLNFQSNTPTRMVKIQSTDNIKRSKDVE